VRRATALDPDDQQPAPGAEDGPPGDHRQALRALAEALITEIETNATGATASLIAAAADALRRRLPPDPVNEQTPVNGSPWALGAGIGFALAALLRHPDR
jgi:hypothetical protein